MEIPAFVPQNVKIKVNENDNDDAGNSNDEESQDQSLIGEISKKQINFNSDPIHPQEFEKDDDTNHHIDFINACSNLRARNYKITECDRFKTKLIAGKIVPAIATTTASITGLVAMQIIIGLTTEKIDFMRDGFINLGVNIYLMTEPGPKIQMKDKEYDPILLGPVKVIPQGFSIWDKIEIKGSKTLGELIEYYDKTYNVDVSIIIAKGQTLYMNFSQSHKERLSTKIEQLYEKLSGKKITESYLILEISCDTKEGDSAIMPTAKYSFI